jgi:hypothetical protein
LLSADNIFIKTIHFAVVLTLLDGAAAHLRPAMPLKFKTNLNYTY